MTLSNVRKRAVLLTILLSGNTFAFAGDTRKSTIDITSAEPWEFSLSMPGWIAGLDGNVGINGVVSSIDLSPEDILGHLDMVTSLRGEASKGRFGVMGEVLYLRMSDDHAPGGLVRLVDAEVSQTLVDFALRWRVVDNPRLSVDVMAGMRYINLSQELGVHPNPGRINTASDTFVNVVGSRVRNGLSQSELRNLIQNRVIDRLTVLENRDPILPLGPLAARERTPIRDRIRAIVDARKAELRAAFQERAQAATTALRARAQRRIDRIKNNLSQQISAALDNRLDRYFSRSDDWFDPYIGLRARYHLNEKWYFHVEGDVGGFGAGSDLSWETRGVVGYELSTNIYAEAGYRALGEDYEGNGLTYDVVTHGAEITVGLKF